MSTIHLDGRNSFSSLGLALTYLWSFGSIPSGSATTLSSTTTSTVSFVPDIAGVYNVKLIVNDGTTSSVATHSVNTLVLLSGTSTVVYTNNTSGIYIVNGNGHNIGTIPSITLPFGATGTFDWDGYTWAYTGSDGTFIPHPVTPNYATWALLSGGGSGNAALSNGNLTATSLDSAGITVQSSISKSSGKWYCELLATSIDIGISNGTGAYIHVPAVTNVGMALDVGAGTLAVYSNGVLTGTQHFTAGTLSNITVSIESPIGSITANFGASAFTYSVPSGYNSGLYS